VHPVVSRFWRATARLLVMLLMLTVQVQPAVVRAETVASTIQQAPYPQHLLQVGSALEHLEAMVTELLEMADESGGIFGWKESMVPFRDALMVELPGAFSELQAIEEYAQAQGLPTAAAEANAVRLSLSTGLTGVLAKIGATLQAPDEEAIGQLQDLRQALAGSSRLEPAQSTVLPFGPASDVPAPSSLPVAPVP